MKRTKILGCLVGLLLMVISPLTVLSQKTVVYVEEDVELKKAIELFQKEKFGAAQKSFVNIINSSRDQRSLARIDAEFYNAICAIELFNKDGELYLKQFIEKYPESPKVKHAYFYLGKYNYRKNKHKIALEWFEKVDIYDLTPDDLTEFYFKRGYSYFLQEDYDLAKKDLYEIKDIDSKYSAPAKYYFAHIAYIQKNYETAMKDFVKLKGDNTFGPVVPYYITQLYFLQKRYSDVIEQSPELLNVANVKRAPEIARIIGEAYYHTNQFEEAIPYFTRYEEEAGHLSREGNYQLGYAYYKTGKYEKALDYFINMTNVTDDSLAQNGYYHIGDCYLQIGYKQRALNTFAQASKLDFDKKIQEDALFTYAKLCYELAYNPYNETIKAFQKYIQNYPNSIHIDEAYSYLVNVFTTTKRFGKALEAIESIKVLSPELKHAHQKVAYYHGVELFNSRDFKNAIKYFDKARIYQFDKVITASATYWKAESYYRLKNYEKSIELYRKYIDEPGSIGKSEWSEANYNIGYSYFNLKDYENSNLWFRKFVTFKPLADPEKINDSYNRIGDGYFMLRNFSEAAEYYTLSYKMGKVDQDYALYQRALAFGVQKKFKQKITDLSSFIDKYGSSPYIQKAKFELAKTYQSDDNTEYALRYYKKFADEYPNSQYVNECLSKIAMIYYTASDDENALAYFDKLIKRDRKSAEAVEAINVIKSIYTAKGELLEMQEYLATIGAAIPQGSLDSLSYNMARNHYMGQDCESAIKQYNKYIQQFPDGIYIIEANFYKAQCYYNFGNMDSCIAGYTYVANREKTEFTEQSLFRVSIILFDMGRFEESFEYFQKLEKQAERSKNNAIAKVGLMRCYYELKNFDAAIGYAKIVLDIPQLSFDLVNESHFIIAKSLLATNRQDDALSEFRAVANATNDDFGAESFYHIANIQNKKGLYDESTKTIFDFVNGDCDSYYWITKSMILLADNYVELDDNFQAKTTLKSVISESETPELIKIAQEKLDKIIADEEAELTKKKETKALELNFEGDSLEQQKLFNNVPSDTLSTEEKTDVFQDIDDVNEE